MTATNIPDHVPSERVYDFNMYVGPPKGLGVHEWHSSLHEKAPDIFFTPALGGHWVVTRFDLASEILMDAENFSNTQRLPKEEKPFLMIPLNTDPPDHRMYRQILTRFFSSKIVMNLQPKIREWAIMLIERVKPSGRCDFTDDIAGTYPVSIFMEMMGLPLENLVPFRTAVVEYFGPLTAERRREVEEQIHAWMREVVEDRRRAPRADLISELVQADVNGRHLTDLELKSMMFLLFVAGMDTVANAMMFAFRHLAGAPETQRYLRENPDRIPDFVEETMRRYSIVNIPRMVKTDMDFHGVQFRAGDMVVCSTAAAGQDERKNPDPRAFKIDREGRSHINFSMGVHNCAGQYLARTEMRIFVEEWMQRIPEFELAPDHEVQERAALVMALKGLELRWPPRP